MMKAAFTTGYGGPEKIEYAEDLPKPQLADEDHVMIKVAAASLNPIDGVRNRGYLRFLVSDKHPHIFGYDVAGVVEDAGPKADGFSVGDRVYSRIPLGPQGTVAEYVSVKGEFVSLAPSNVSLSDASSFPLVGLAVVQAFRAGNLKNGQTIFISKGAGGVGTFAIQLAKHVYGCHVITTATEDKAQLLRDLGADVVIDYTKVNFRQVVKNVDFSFDVSNEPYAHAAITKRGGYVVALRGIPSPEAIHDTFNYEVPFVLAKALKVVNVTAYAIRRLYGVQYHAFSGRPSGADLAEIKEYIEKGQIKPVIDTMFDIRNSRQAMEKVEGGHSTGKVVVRVDTSVDM
ncbi:chaperonin 10-like protein [Yarrowia lipolytica]|uniref:Chaperonin 10-like protein n=1 Tax=Yarrowia lipolytica TaxID=4952 RepID=A0A371CE98_YARLL|nr:2-methylene-furan-3-one reductase [Yarrowia lipolytica]RDW28608.1 chaperonin 10-like protein [Yarrowia lipolytica]RDW35133.1 chaperonin 10-like protein [Yarrowia lipolytica]RDW37952.1 chaperonin 10-like protein [Yarrowia lipolytica]RDW46868.1 chaperonin 10-like protein [Yarrowia lipolytica]